MGVPIYEPTKRRVHWANGAMVTTFSAEEPDRLRGPQHDFMWCDELAAWKNATDSWDMAMLGLRIGRNPQCMISTTPKPIPLIRELLRMDTCVKTVATTYDNVTNLAPSFFDRIIKRYEGTRLGRQELSGQLIEETEGALWTREMIENARLSKALPDMRRVVVSIDPAVTENPTSNLTGIVVAGRGVDNRGYVLEDLSGRYSPDMWARTAIHAFDPTASDARDVMVEGSSGLLATAWSKDETIDGVHMGVPIYEPTPMVTTFSAEEPDRLRGPQHDFMWCDELAAWKNATDAWDMAMLGLRIGRNPQCMISTTPKPIPLIRELLRMDATCAKTVATTYDNVPNLAPSFFDRIIKRVPS